MKKLCSLKRVVQLSTAVVFTLILLVVYSCRKELKMVPLSATDSVDAARSWYEKSFPVNNALGVNNNLATLGVNSNSNGAPFDYSQHIKPDWNHNARYKRFNKDVIEMPVDPSHFLNLGMKNANTGQLISAKENSRAWFLLLNDGKTYDAYIMVLIGDPSYINGDPSRMAKNSYRKRDDNFSGMLLYFTPKGKFIRSYQYKNGQQVTSSSTLSGSNPSTQTQSVNKKTNQLQAECTPWYMDYYIDGIFQYEVYVYTTCEVYDDGTDTNPYGGSSNPCQVINSVTQRAINHVAPGDGGDGGNDPNDPTNPIQGFPVVGQTQTCSDQDRKNILNDFLAYDDKFLFDCDSLTLMQINPYYSYGDMYQQVAQFTPSSTIQSRLTSLNAQGNLSFSPFTIQNLSQAFGTVVNSDFFPIDISSLPPGMTMASITEYFRLNINQFTSGQAAFSPYSDQYVNDTQLFSSPGSQSVGALIHINMANNGTVVESDYQSNNNGSSFKFSTMTSPLDNTHPVSGNREFGVYTDPNNPGHYTFYTMGVDRTSDWMFALMNWSPSSGSGMVFNGADKLWAAMQANMISFINNNGGQAGYYPSKRFVARPDYSTVQNYLDGSITLDQLKQKIGCP